MDKKGWWLGLHSLESHHYKTDEQVRAQWESGPKVLGPTLVDKMIQRRKATKAKKPSENSPHD